MPRHRKPRDVMPRHRMPRHGMPFDTINEVRANDVARNIMQAQPPSSRTNILSRNANSMM